MTRIAQNLSDAIEYRLDLLSRYRRKLRKKKIDRPSPLNCVKQRSHRYSGTGKARGSPLNVRIDDDDVCTLHATNIAAF
jgi:hypothetical protein